SKAYLVEVKFRSRFDDKATADLKAELDHQRKYWPTSYAVLMIGEPFVKGGRYHQDYIRVVGPDHTDSLVDSRFTPETRWDGLGTVEKVFKPQSGASGGVAGQADSITHIIKQLAGM